MGNFVKIDRKILKWEWWSDINTFRLFMYMLLAAWWKDGKYKGNDIFRGSFPSSIAELSKETNLTENEIRTALKHLKRTGEITSKSHSKYTVFTVKNYDAYQSNNKQDYSEITGEITSTSQPDNEQLTIKSHSVNKQITNLPIIKENKNIRNKEYKEDKKERKKENNNISPALQNVPHGQIVINLPLNDKTFREIYQSEVEHWSELYPAVDVLQELRKMVGWCESNPQNMKTRRGSGKFITNWLAKAQDRSGRIRESPYIDAIKNRVSEVDKWV